METQRVDFFSAEENKLESVIVAMEWTYWYESYK